MKLISSLLNDYGSSSIVHSDNPAMLHAPGVTQLPAPGSAIGRVSRALALQRDSCRASGSVDASILSPSGWMIDNGYQDARTLERRARAMEEWLENPSLMRADADAEYAEVIEINMSEITEPLLACPNDPDDVKPLSEVQGTKIDEVFIGSCMTNIAHFRAAAKLLA